MCSMSSKERMMTSFRLGEPDMIPVSPDVSNMFPCKYTGKPFWQIYLTNDPPLWRAYLELLKLFKFDGWVDGSQSMFDLIKLNSNLKFKVDFTEIDPTKIDIKATVGTPKGELTTIMRFPKREPPWTLKGLIENPEADFEKLKELIWDPWRRNKATFQEIYKNIGNRGVVFDGFPIFSEFWHSVRGKTEKEIMDHYEYPGLMKELLKILIDLMKEQAHASCTNLNPDEVVIGGSCASLSVSSPKIFREFNLPVVKEVAKICREYDIPCHLHVCGKSRAIVDMVADTDLNVMEPLERPPSGDINLAEVKTKYGRKLCLKGNIHTIETMLHGTEKTVEQEVKRCIRDAGEGGGYVLSTGDQVPHMTPEKNFIALIKSGRKWGRYPLKAT
jgi:uroporphyrinogen decarboxylase